MGTNNNFSYRPVNNQGHWNVFNLGYMLPRMSTLASRINEALNDKGWSQERLAEVCNKIEPDSISQVAIHKIASGKSKTTRKGPILAKALQVEIDWLLTGEGQKRNPFVYAAHPELAERDGVDFNALSIARAALDDEMWEAQHRSAPISQENGDSIFSPAVVKTKASSLISSASPRSKQNLEKIIQAASDGRLSEEDISLLNTIAERIAKKE